MEWIHLAHDRIQWLALVNTKPCGFHEMREIYQLAEALLASYEELCSTDLVHLTNMSVTVLWHRVVE